MERYEPPNERQPVGRNVILVVEDDANVLENIVELLEAEGFETRQARNGEEAYQAILANPPDLIISDVLMPRLDGKALLARLSQTSLLPTIPFIFLSALIERADLRAGMGLGADDYITKPFTRRDLLDAVTRRLQRRRKIQAEVRHESQRWQENLLRALPYEMLQPLSTILSLAGQIESSLQPGMETLGGSAARAIRHTGEGMSRTLTAYLLLEEISQPAEVSADQGEGSLLRAELGANLEGLLQVIGAENDRAEELRCEVAPAAVALEEGKLLRIVEELVRLSLASVPPGSGLALRGMVNPAGDAYELTLASVRPFLDPLQLEWLRNERALSLPEFMHLGVGFALACKLTRHCGGQLEAFEPVEGGGGVRLCLPLAPNPA